MEETKEKLLESLKGLEEAQKEGKEGGSLKAPLPYIENRITTTSQRVGEALEKAQRERGEEIKALEEEKKDFQELKANFPRLYGKMKREFTKNPEKEKDFLKHIAKAFFPFVEEFRKLQPDLVKQYEEEFKDKPIYELIKIFYDSALKITDEEIKRREASLFAPLDLSRRHGRKEERALSIPFPPELSKITKKETSFLISGEDERIKTYIAQKVGLLKNRDPEGLRKITEKPILDIKEIKKVCKVGERKAYEILQTFSKVNFITPVPVDTDKDGDLFIHYLKVKAKKDGTGENLLKPFLSLDALQYIQAYGQKVFFPPVDSKEVSSLDNFSFKLLKKLGAIQHQIEGHQTKEPPREFWLQINTRVLYEDFLNEATEDQNRHKNRLKEKFLKALSQLTENGLFLKPPFLCEPYFTKDWNLNRAPRVGNSPDLMKGEKVSLEAMKRAGTTWADIMERSLLFCLSFISMDQRGRERVRCSIEAKRKRRAKQREAIKNCAVKPSEKKPRTAPPKVDQRPPEGPAYVFPDVE